MSEEIQSAATVVPQALMWTVIINGTLAWAMVFAMMFCAGDLSAALEAQKTMFYPFLEIILQAVKSKGTACALVSITVVMAIASGVGLYASASRMIWSFSRDRGLPFHSHLVKVCVHCQTHLFMKLTAIAQQKLTSCDSYLCYLSDHHGAISCLSVGRSF